jgi:hypothetical protein
MPIVIVAGLRSEKGRGNSGMGRYRERISRVRDDDSAMGWAHADGNLGDRSLLLESEKHTCGATSQLMELPSQYQADGCGRR